MATVLTPEEIEEFKRLYGEYRHAVVDAHDTLFRFGIESEQYVEADAKSVEILNRIRKLRGEPESDWIT